MIDADLPDQPEDYTAIATQLAAGIASQFSADQLTDVLVNAGVKVTHGTLHSIYVLFEEIAAGLGKFLVDVEEPVLPILGALIAPIVANMFGTSIDPSLFARRENRAGRSEASAAIVDAYMSAMTGGTPGALEPGDAGAKRLAGAGVHAALEGWLNGIIPEVLSDLLPFDIGHFHDFTELSEAIIRALGVGRLTRRALSPLVDVTAATPMRWHVNRTFTPSLLSETLAVKQFLRGKWTRGQLDEEMARQGWSHDRIDAYINAAQQFFGPGDVRQFVSRDAWTQDRGLQHLRDQGYSDDAASDALRLEGLKEIESLETREADAAITAYANGDIDRGTFDRVLGTAVQISAARHLFTELAEVKRTVSIKHLTHAEVRECVKMHIASTAFYRDWLARENYAPDEAFMLELRLRKEIDDATALEQHRQQQIAERAAELLAKQRAAVAKLAAVEAERALHRRGSLAELSRAAVRGLIPVSRVEEVLRAQYDGDTVGILVGLVQDDRARYLADQQRAEEARQKALRRNLDVGALESAVLENAISVNDFATRLRQLGFEPADADVLTRTVQARKADLDAARARRDEAVARAKQKLIDLPRAETLVRRGVYTLTQYDDLLKQLDYEDGSRAAMVDLLKLKIADDAKAADERAAAQAKRDAHGLTLEDARRAVVLGVHNDAWFQTWLIDNGFTTDAQIVLLADVRDRVSEADAARQRRAAAGAPPGARGLPLSTLARAARLGVIPIATYDARLRRDGYSPEDLAIDHDLLVAEIAAVQAARAKRDRPTPEPIPPGLSLAQLERAIKLGTATIDDYRARAVVLRYPPEDVDTLVATLVEELGALADARARKEAIEMELKPRNLSIAQLDQAVKADLMTMDQYVQAVEALGYGTDDADLLAALLTDELSAAAAKATNG